MIFSAQKNVLRTGESEQNAEALTQEQIVEKVVDYVTSGFNVARFNMGGDKQGGICRRGEGAYPEHLSCE